MKIKKCSTRRDLKPGLAKLHTDEFCYFLWLDLFNSWSVITKIIFLINSCVAMQWKPRGTHSKGRVKVWKSGPHPTGEEWVSTRASRGERTWAKVCMTKVPRWSGNTTSTQPLRSSTTPPAVTHPPTYPTHNLCSSAARSVIWQLLPATYCWPLFVPNVLLKQSLN